MLNLGDNVAVKQGDKLVAGYVNGVIRGRRATEHAPELPAMYTVLPDGERSLTCCTRCLLESDLTFISPCAREIRSLNVPEAADQVRAA